MVDYGQCNLQMVHSNYWNLQSNFKIVYLGHNMIQWNHCYKLTNFLKMYNLILHTVHRHFDGILEQYGSFGLIGD